MVCVRVLIRRIAESGRDFDGPIDNTDFKGSIWYSATKYSIAASLAHAFSRIVQATRVRGARIHQHNNSVKWDFQYRQTRARLKKRDAEATSEWPVRQCKTSYLSDGNAEMHTFYLP